MPRVWLWGPKWKRLFDIRTPLMSEVSPEAARYHPLLVYNLESDVRELVCERLRFDVVAEWADAREQIGA